MLVKAITKIIEVIVEKLQRQFEKNFKKLSISGIELKTLEIYLKKLQNLKACSLEEFC